MHQARSCILCETNTKVHQAAKLRLMRAGEVASRQDFTAMIKNAASLPKSLLAQVFVFPYSISAHVHMIHNYASHLFCLATFRSVDCEIEHGLEVKDSSAMKGFQDMSLGRGIIIIMHAICFVF